MDEQMGHVLCARTQMEHGNNRAYKGRGPATESNFPFQLRKAYHAPPAECIDAAIAGNARLLRGQLVMHFEPPQKQEPVAFHTAEQRCIVCDPNPEPRDKQPEAGTFCFAQGCFLCMCEFVRCLRFSARCNDVMSHLPFPFCTMRFSCALCNIFLTIMRSSLCNDVILSACQQLGVLDVLDTATSLRRHDVRPLLNPAIGSACRDHVQADLSTLWSRVGSDIVLGECQALPGFSAAPLPG